MTIDHSPLRCPVCDSALARDTVRPPCSAGCVHPNGAPRLAELRGPRSGRPVCGPCSLREVVAAEATGWTAEERDEWVRATLRDAARESGKAW